MIKTNKGFTLIELLVVVLIIGILAAMAMPQYFKAVERSRMTEADTLLASIAQAQRRKYLQLNKFTENFSSLDVAPKGASGATYYTKGGAGNGFKVTISGDDFSDGAALAERSGANTLQYDYSLHRYYENDNVSCIANNAAGGELCADFCGIDTAVTDGNNCCNDGTSGTGTTYAGRCAAPTSMSGD